MALWAVTWRTNQQAAQSKPPHAKGGLLNIMVASDKDTFEKVRPVPDVPGEDVFWLGIGHVTKPGSNFMKMKNVYNMSQAFIPPRSPSPHLANEDQVFDVEQPIADLGGLCSEGLVRLALQTLGAIFSGFVRVFSSDVYLEPHSGHLTLSLRCSRQNGGGNVGSAEKRPYARAAIADAAFPRSCRQQKFVASASRLWGALSAGGFWFGW